MIARYHTTSLSISRKITHQYSTSFSLGTRLLGRHQRQAVYALYGFVRVADEIVDTFLEHDQARLLEEFKQQTAQAIQDGLSTNPVLHSFAQAVREYNIKWEYIEAFFNSMACDLEREKHDRRSYDTYIYGSAEVVGLMCLQIFCEGDDAEFERLKEPARRLGAAFQKVNFLRDVRDDYQRLGRTYFPGAEVENFSEQTRHEIEAEIDADFQAALEGIRQLPASSRLGVLTAYMYYKALFRKIRSASTDELLSERIRIPNSRKMALMVEGALRSRLNLI